MRRPRIPSLRLRLLLLVLLVTTVGVGAAAVASYFRTLHEADEMLDAQLAQTARTLLTIASVADLDEVAEDFHAASHRYQTRVLFQLWQDDGAGAPPRHRRRHHHHTTGRSPAPPSSVTPPSPRVLLVRSAGAPETPLGDLARDGFATVEREDRPWRAFVLAEPRHGLRVIAAQSLEIRDRMAAEVARDNLWPLAIALPLLLGLLLVAGQRALEPLKTLARELGTRRADRLDPIALGDAPSEFAPALTALNAFLARLDAALERERRFTADAAHELRTPLAALAAQLQVARLTGDSAAGRAALEKAIWGASRLGHLIDQLLQLARLEAGKDEEQGAPGYMLDLAAVARQVCADLGPAAVARHQTLELEAGQAQPVAAQGDLLAVLARNLVDNAIRYAPEGGRVLVEVAARGQDVILRVADDGPGVSPELRDALGRPFRRLSPETAEGVGLGLSIVRRIADLHQARIEFGGGLAGRGLGVTVILPRPTP